MVKADALIVSHVTCEPIHVLIEEPASRSVSVP